MTRANRWDNLDFEPPAGQQGRAGHRTAGRTAPGQEPAARARSEPPRVRIDDPLSSAEPPEVVQASGAYMLRSYQVVVDLLEPRLRSHPDLPGGQRILGQALARLNREAEAGERLREAVRQSPPDWLARASLSSLLLRSHDGPLTSIGQRVIRPAALEAAAHLEAALETALRPALQELLGAAYWRAGQESLEARQDREAGRLFAASATQFAAAARASGAARLALPVRQSSALVGQAVSLLVAGQTEAAQRLFSRSGLSGIAAGGPPARFAAGLYELCDALAELPEAERPEAAAPLRDVILETRLQVGFYDGRQAVSLIWVCGLP